nr:transposase [Roseivivax halodurans]
MHCWTHLRRRFVKQRETDGSPIAEQVLHRIANLYAVEKAVRCGPPVTRLAPRRARAAPIVAAFCPLLEAQLSRIPRSTKLAEDIRYTLGLWPGLIRFLGDGQLEQNTNPVENQIRSIALTRKNALFAGHEVGAENRAMLASLIATCKMRDVNPVNYIAQTLRALLDGHPNSRIKALMPWQFQDPSSLAA